MSEAYSEINIKKKANKTILKIQQEEGCTPKKTPTKKVCQKKNDKKFNLYNLHLRKFIFINFAWNKKESFNYSKKHFFSVYHNTIVANASSLENRPKHFIDL